jgi:hypothetical protein
MGIEIVGILWAIPGSLVLVFLVICVLIGAARRYTVPTLIASALVSAAVAANRTPPSEHLFAFYTSVFLGTFFFVGTTLGLIALLIRAVARREP